MSEADLRYIELEGCYNFRDLGGYPGADGRRVRLGQLYRSDALHHVTPRDVERVRDGLGLRHVVDVRSRSEVALELRSRLLEPPIDYHHVPLFSDEPRDDVEIPEDLGHRYFLILSWARDPIARVIELIAGARDPLVFHCAAGKDRTGVLSALVLGLLGVGDADIVNDYVATTRNLEAIIARLSASPSYKEIFTELPPETLHADASTMQSLLERVRQRYGSLAGYADEVGIGPSLVSQLRTRLLEDA